MMRRFINQRGDTIVEVTIAMSIMSAVIISAFVLANRAFGIGQVARERSVLSNALQQQAEALTSFRNATKWAQFTTGSAPSYAGVSSFGGGCFHMEVRSVAGLNQWVPIAGVVPVAQVAVPTAAICVKGAAAGPTSYKFNITYDASAYGGGTAYTQDVVLILTSLDTVRGNL